MYKWVGHSFPPYPGMHNSSSCRFQVSIQSTRLAEAICIWQHEILLHSVVCFEYSMAHLRQLFSIPRLSLSGWGWTWPRYGQNWWGNFCVRSFQLRNVGQCQHDHEVITQTESRPCSRINMTDSSLDPVQKSKAVMSFVMSSAIELWSVKSIMLLSISTKQRAVSIHSCYP